MSYVLLTVSGVSFLYCVVCFGLAFNSLLEME